MNPYNLNDELIKINENFINGYLTYPILETVFPKLSWGHWFEILKISDPLERSFYQKSANHRLHLTHPRRLNRHRNARQHL